MFRLLYHWPSETHEHTKENLGLGKSRFLKHSFTCIRSLRITNKATLQAWNLCSAGQ